MSIDFPLENLLIRYRSQNETIQMKATAYYFLVVLFRLIKCSVYPRYYYSWLNTGFLAEDWAQRQPFDTGNRRRVQGGCSLLYNYLHITNWYPRHTSTIHFAAKPYTQTFYTLHGYRGEWDHLACSCHANLTKQPTFGDATSSFPAKWRLRNERRNSILMTRHYPDMGSASDWSCRVGNLIQAIRRTTQIWV